MAPKPLTHLTVEMLERFRARVAGLDEANAYFDEDLAELREFGYLRALPCLRTWAVGVSTSPRCPPANGAWLATRRRPLWR